MINFKIRKMRILDLCLQMAICEAPEINID